MDMDLLKKALPKGILLGLVIGVIAVLARLSLNGTSFFSQLFTFYGIRAMIGIPGIWVIYFYREEMKKANPRSM